MICERVSGTDGCKSVWVTENLWSAEQHLHPSQTTFSRTRIAIAVQFDLPADLPESGNVLDDPQIVWPPDIRPGTVLDRSLTCSFDIPVFRKRRAV